MNVSTVIRNLEYPLANFTSQLGSGRNLEVELSIPLLFDSQEPRL